MNVKPLLILASKYCLFLFILKWFEKGSIAVNTFEYVVYECVLSVLYTISKILLNFCFSQKTLFSRVGELTWTVCSDLFSKCLSNMHVHETENTHTLQIQHDDRSEVPA